jgi:hypothetical protein
MLQEEPPSHFNDLYQLVADANLSMGLFQGTGLGAVLLALIAIAFIRSRPFSSSRLSDLVRAWRGGGRPPAE